ncbi:hypothetical protein RS022_00780 [Candidatus Phytoplasma rubi]|uniref:Uncharacterized protein n=1 Tax=Candidatus Phytoplasma rubi TaxID=399025 RepID=A0ABY7BTH9_9MOLU|nr:hypothetical protein RS022_00780 [Candidatus Phytoplasma rubi]
MYEVRNEFEELNKQKEKEYQLTEEKLKEIYESEFQ